MWTSEVFRRFCDSNNIAIECTYAPGDSAAQRHSRERRLAHPNGREGYLSQSKRCLGIVYSSIPGIDERGDRLWVE